MMEYISREAALNAVKQSTGLGNTAFCDKWDAMNRIRNIPAANVREVKKASWYGEADGYADGELVYDMWSCPICGKYFPEWDEKPDWNFCPNCGADMRGETE